MKYEIEWTGNAFMFKKLSSKLQVEAPDGLEALKAAEVSIEGQLSKGLRPYAIEKVSIKDQHGNCDIDLNQIRAWASEFNKRGQKPDL